MKSSNIKNLFIAAMMLISQNTVAQIPVTLDDVASGKRFRLEGVKTGEVLGLQDYSRFTKDGRYEMVQQNREYVYRRSSTVDCRFLNKETGKEVTVDGRVMSPLWSPDSRNLAFVRNNNIYIINVEGEETAVTQDGRFNYIINGQADWVYEEEFSQTRMFDFTADGQALVWVRFDESNVKQVQLQFHDGDTYPRAYDYKYPKAGEENSKVSLHAWSLSDKKARKIDLDIDKEDYIPVVRQIPGNNEEVLVVTVNRHQDEMKVWRVNALTGETRNVLLLGSKCYLPEEAVTDLSLFPEGMVVLNDNDGAMQPFLYDYEGKLVRRLIADPTVIVTAFYGYEPKAQKSYFQAVDGSAMRRSVFVSDKKGRLAKLSEKDGWNTASFSDDYKRYIICHSDKDTPNNYTLYDGKKRELLEENARVKEEMAKAEMPVSEFFSFTTSEGVTLNGVIYKPKDFDPSKKYPLIMHQYSGPGSQQVIDSWAMGCLGRGGIFEAMMCRKGYICVQVDPRGTKGRGADFQKLTYLKMGQMESRDQVEAAIYLGSMPYIDKNRIAIWGWSYGGFNTLMSMSEGRPVFRCGVSIAPPTDWRFYDSVYTERFMRTPQENPEGYGDNPIKRAEKLSGDLLICHGLCDDNVHPQNTFEYTTELIENGKQFDMHIFTNSDHGIRFKHSRKFLLEKVVKFFDEKLK